MKDITHELKSQVEVAYHTRIPLVIRGGGSKAFYGNPISGLALNVSGHSGIVSYEPTELVITARAGTSLREIETTLAAQNQMLPFEPPHFGATATLGGTIACGLSGPRRPFTGAARDYVLGTRIINGRGEVMKFGGEVMKNVAGYDVSRLMTGALGTLGVLLEISLKVLPTPESEITLQQQCDAKDAVARLTTWQRQAIPLSAACHHEGQLLLRLSGAASAVDAWRKKVGGDVVVDGEAFWIALREHTLPFFQQDAPLWRWSVPASSPARDTKSDVLLDWGGAQRWVHSDEPAERIRERVASIGGHATLFRGPVSSTNRFHPLPPGVSRVQQQLKIAFDPAGILNRGKLFAEW